MRGSSTPTPAVLALLACSLVTSACGSNNSKTGGDPTEPMPMPMPMLSCLDDGTTLQLDCPAMPNTNPEAQPDWDRFAWNSFIALNWPAVDPTSNNNQRGFPDLSSTFANAPNSGPLVWETFKEKREVFFHGSDQVPGAWNQPVQYGPLDEQIPVCPSSASELPERLLAQGSEINSLAETIEVGSEALEPGEELCGGYSTDPQCGTASAAPCCDVHGLSVGPRAWKGDPTKANPQPVVYEVKVNWDFYDYVVTNDYYTDAIAATAASGGQIMLPFRTSASAGPGGPNPAAVTMYSAQNCVDDYYSLVTPTSDQLPCPTGTIHLKAAWILLEDEDQTQYLTTDGLYFKTENGETCMTSGTFGLIGLHIIQRIHQGAVGDPMAGAIGGTFIYATWEHVDNDTEGFTYANDYQGQGPITSPAFGFYPHPSQALPVTRMFPILDNTQQVNQEVHDALGCPSNSLWCNYRLVGTQFQAINVDDLPPANPAFPVGPNDPTGIGQPVYLANLVIETNQGLQQFQGQLPLVEPIQNFQAKGVLPNNENAFARSNKNLSFLSTAYNMGGCMGCHGVAQSVGYSFSYVLLGGQQAAVVDTQQSFEIPPLPGATPTPTP